MKKISLKRVLAAASTAILSLALLAVAAPASHQVSAAAEDTPKEQTIILTKYGFSSDQALTERPTNEEWDGAGAKSLAGVEFEVYDVTAKYWADPTGYKGDISDLISQESLVTDGQGQATITLPTTEAVAGQQTRSAVYLFHETNPRAGYGTSADFWLTLPAKAADDGNVYVYPKNTVKETYQQDFVKQDSVTDEVLAGAEFVIQNTDKQYLQLTDKDGQALENVPAGFVDVLAGNYRLSFVAAKENATVFTSDKDGKFGLNGFADMTTEYIASETKAPAGYERAKDTSFHADDDSEPVVIEDQPTGILPHTGGNGIVVFIAIGVALIAGGSLVYLKRRRAF
ncbi:SpaA isopeptide-forming pilin-related protein [Lapidilactobacillus luobeiensis]|uniref:SpaA isopeptide-forming pilin-related protein n=1 Tax=Lapidilactobacillus luobeiensis TaxID=2950371 RepID=UPI0021C2C3C2|nr:pilin N-terminal domain-containing protein [Lapidilactobacillus luobeiensis]